MIEEHARTVSTLRASHEQFSAPASPRCNMKSPRRSLILGRRKLRMGSSDKLQECSITSPTPTTAEALTSDAGTSATPGVAHRKSVGRSPSSTSANRGIKKYPSTEDLESHAERLEQAAANASSAARHRMLMMAARERRRSTEKTDDELAVDGRPAQGSTGAAMLDRKDGRRACRARQACDDPEQACHATTMRPPAMMPLMIQHSDWDEVEDSDSLSQGEYREPPSAWMCMVEALHSVLGCDATLR